MRTYRASTEAMSHAVELLLSNAVLFDSQANTGGPYDLINEAATKAEGVRQDKEGHDNHVCC